MRPILFRGKRTDNREWIFGSLVNENGVCSIIDYANTETDTYSWFDIDPETLGQFTGLTDCEGRKIFEGDIVKNTCMHDKSFLIERRIDFENNCFLPLEIGDLHGRLGCFTDWRTFKIIGNIADDPELIKKAT